MKNVSVRERLSRKLPGDSSSGFHAIILAAGRSSRMKREKASLPWIDGVPLLPWMFQSLSAAGWQTTAVVGPESYAHWCAVLPAGCAVLNPEPCRGKTSSLACGVEILPPNANWILVSAVDQPRRPALYLRLREEAEKGRNQIIVPNRAGSRGHPVVLSGSFRDKLVRLDENAHGLRGLLDAYRTQTYRLPDDDPEEPQWDLNTPDAYEEALRREITKEAVARGERSRPRRAEGGSARPWCSGQRTRLLGRATIRSPAPPTAS